ncbi:hypothetical protein DFH08DRAFT_935664 [Mycena albidolilacea]|uniref:AB hydrolase-1 domain-containing protein n=1 Tax=Mycena albidolilacea TaxID=1033008 RepID=A0AAD7A504_9AGAR|nr:hypothetical protein DFH08DRAFT_935664 [Mycena albidolilacea]
MSTFRVKSIVFNPGPDEHALKLTAKCYSPGTNNPNGLTLSCAHGTGIDVPFVGRTPGTDSIFKMHENTNCGFSLREVWSVDWQSHGLRAVVNEATLSDRPADRPAVSVVEWAEAIAEFIQSPHLRGHHIVGIGHSAGSSAPNDPKFASANRVVCRSHNCRAGDVPQCSQDFYRDYGEERNSALSTAIMIVNARRTTWPNRDEAFSYMKLNFIWKGWDARVLRTYVDYGMHDLPGSDGVVISTKKEQEISAYTNVPPHLEAVDLYRRIVPWVPVHFIFGARNDLVPPEAQDSIFDPGNNIQASSIQCVHRAGHMVLQEKPDGLAVAICKVLAQIKPRGVELASKL